MFKNFSIVFFTSIGIWLFAFMVSYFLVSGIPTIQVEETYNIDETDFNMELYGKDIVKIFANNERLIVSNLLGCFSLGILPLINLIINGLVLGGVVFYAYNCGMNVHNIACRTLPHFTEYLAIWFSATFGICSVLYAIKNRASLIKKETIQTYCFLWANYFIICTIFTFVGAVMEVCIAGRL
ncbi:MAG: stage II sporulation protein M [Spirochaetaceae bacterium]|nr:stage II sporulation protein M [Spirochaetaceae bacterium]